MQIHDPGGCREKKCLQQSVQTHKKIEKRMRSKGKASNRQKQVSRSRQKRTNALFFHSLLRATRIIPVLWEMNEDAMMAAAGLRNAQNDGRRVVRVHRAHPRRKAMGQVP